MADTPARKPPSPLRLQVLHSRWLTPHMVRVVLGGDRFAGFVDNGFTDRYVKLVFPAPGHPLPDPLDFGQIRAALPREQWPRVRTYTVRCHDPASRELAVDFVVHGDAGVAGPWAASAAPGDDLTLLGPGGAYAPRADADWHLLVGDDERGARHRRRAGGDARGGAGAGARRGGRPRRRARAHHPRRPRPHVAPPRRPRPPGGRHARGRRPVAGVPPRPGPGLRPRRAGRHARLRPHLLRERGVDIELLSLSGYWRRGKDEDGFQAEKADDARREREAAARD